MEKFHAIQFYITYISVLVFLPKGNKLCYSITFSQQNLKIHHFVVVVVVVIGVIVGASVGVIVSVLF